MKGTTLECILTTIPSLCFLLSSVICSYRSLLSSSLDEKSQDRRYHQVQHRGPHPGHHRGGGYVDRRGGGGDYNRPHHNSGGYRRPPERRYDGGHRAGFRSAPRKGTGGYGKGMGLSFYVLRV